MVFGFNTSKKPYQLILTPGQESMLVRMVDDPTNIGPITVICPECLPSREQPAVPRCAPIVPKRGCIEENTRLSLLGIGQVAYCTLGSLYRDAEGRGWVVGYQTAYTNRAGTQCKVTRVVDGFEVEVKKGTCIADDDKEYRDQKAFDQRRFIPIMKWTEV